MKKSDHKHLILKELDSGPVSLGTLKKKCGQGNKINSIRKALHSLLSDGTIEPCGYEEGCENFKYDCIKVKKVNTDYKNPIYVKGLLDSPLESDNYHKIQKIFKKRIEEVNRVYYSEIKKLTDAQGKMTLQEAIDIGHFKSDGNYRGHTFMEFLDSHPDATVCFLEKRFSSQLAMISMNSNIKYPYFGDKLLTGYFIEKSFLDHYKEFLDHLPINQFDEQKLFKHFVIGALKDKGENKEDLLWDLAFDLTETSPSLFVQKLRVIINLNEEDFESLGRYLHF